MTLKELEDYIFKIPADSIHDEGWKARQLDCVYKVWKSFALFLLAEQEPDIKAMSNRILQTLALAEAPSCVKDLTAAYRRCEERALWYSVVTPSPDTVEGMYLHEELVRRNVYRKLIQKWLEDPTLSPEDRYNLERAIKE